MTARQAGLFDAPQELPQGLLYQPDFLTVAEEDALLAAIAPLPLRDAKFREYFAKRRVAHFHGANDAPAYDDGGADSFTSGPLPGFLIALREKVARRLAMAPEAFVHALVSEYRPGTPIGWHLDKPQYGIVAGVSLASSARMRWRPYAHQDVQHTVTLDLAPRSLYVMREAIRWQWQHSMPPVKALRYSITLRTRAAPEERRF
jgi:alkylated DNA repair dioxygenase AlkB